MTRLSRHADLSSHWTIALSSRTYLLLIAGLTVFHFILAGVIPLSSEELYYWNWARDLGWGYVDGPPFVAHLIALSTAIFGDNPFGVRFFACLGCFFVLWELGRIAGGNFLLKTLLATPVVLYGGIWMHPTVPLLVSWTLYLMWLRRICGVLSQWEADPVSRVYHKSPVPWALWVVGGVILGFGVMSKYFMLFAAACLLVMLIFNFRFQAWWAGYLLHLAIALAVASPLVAYNWDADFAPFLNSWNAALLGHGFSFSQLCGNLWTQTLIIGLAPLLLFPWVLIRPRGTTENPTLIPHFYLYVFPGVWFFYRAAVSPVEPALPLVAYVSFWTLAQRAIEGSSFQAATRLLVALSFLPALVTSALLTIHAKRPLDLIRPEQDAFHRILAQNALYDDLGQTLSGRVVFSTDVETVSHLRYRGIRAKQFAQSLPRSEYSLAQADPCAHESVAVVADGRIPRASLGCFTRVSHMKSAALAVRGQVMKTLDVVLYEKTPSEVPDETTEMAP